MPDYSELLSRIEQASGPDREIDADIDVLLFGGETVWKQANYTMEMYPASRRASKSHIGGFANEHVPLYTASLDATVALVERMLPGWTIASIGQDDAKGWHAELRKGFRTSYSTVQLGGATTPSLALLTALFRALEAKETGNG